MKNHPSGFAGWVIACWGRKAIARSQEMLKDTCYPATIANERIDQLAG